MGQLPAAHEGVLCVRRCTHNLPMRGVLSPYTLGKGTGPDRLLKVTSC